MLKRLYLPLYLISSVAFSQPAQSPLQAMIDTEHAFAKMAKDQNRRDAFLFYLADDVVTTGTDGPRVGKAHIEKQAVTSDWLFWYVAFADVAASGDFGYTTGPWEYRKARTDEKPIAFGEFNSIWKKQPDGTWKNILDIGISHTSPDHEVKAYSPAPPPKHATAIKAEKQVEDLESEFISAFQSDRVKAYQKYLSPQARLDHEGLLPITSAGDKRKYLSHNLPVITFQPQGGQTASSHDLGYAYGKALVTLQQEGKDTTKTGTYLRVWKWQNNSWKIVLDVLTY